ncbi:serine hydrolase [Nocardia concava]|uniref:serine hydrolase n=1 Tax=Nocardia concava TaxID=257281 RepID=UPI0002DD1F8A|nr:serine hydrolase [Nocardia concava]
MTPIQARTPHARWTWIAAGSFVAVISLAALGAPRALATSRDQIGLDQLPETPPPGTTLVVPRPISVTAIAQQMQAAIQAASPGTTVGIDVVDTTTGAPVASLNADQQFYTASVVKLLIALDTLEDQNWQPDSDTADRVSEMLSASNDYIADWLWDTGGNNAIIDRMVSAIGLNATTAPEDIAQWGETLTTPRDVVSIFRYISTGIPASARDLILGALHNASETASDGTNQYFGIPDALTGATWAVKQGWMELNSSTTLATTGLVSPSPDQPYRYAVVVLSTQPAGTDWSVAGAALTAGVQLLHAVLK